MRLDLAGLPDPERQQKRRHRRPNAFIHDGDACYRRRATAIKHALDPCDDWIVGPWVGYQTLRRVL